MDFFVKKLTRDSSYVFLIIICLISGSVKPSSLVSAKRKLVFLTAGD